MRLFSVHAAPEPGGAAPPAPPRPPVVLREGFAPLAFLFGVFWFAAHRLWAEAAAMLALSAAAAWLLPDAAGSVALLALHLIAGFEGRDRLRARLARRGLPEVAVVAAPEADLAWFRLAAQRPDLVRVAP